MSFGGFNGFGGGGPPKPGTSAPPTGPPGPRPDGAAKEGDAQGQGQGQGRYALPPKCPRCDLVKTQADRYITNYQKTYRKKVEGLRGELKNVRMQSDGLRQQVRRLKSVTNIHLSSLLIGIILGSTTKAVLGSLQGLFKKRPVKQAAAMPGAATEEQSSSEVDGVSEVTSTPQLS